MRPEMLLIAQQALCNDPAARQEGQESVSPTCLGIGGHASRRVMPLLDLVWLPRRICAGLTNVFGIGRALPPIEAAGKETSFSTGTATPARSRTVERISAPTG